MVFDHDSSLNQAGALLSLVYKTEVSWRVPAINAVGRVAISPWFERLRCYLCCSSEVMERQSSPNSGSSERSPEDETVRGILVGYHKGELHRLAEQAR
jgi:hypothetical protein